MDNLRGIFLMVLSMAFFAVEDAIIKALSARLSVGTILIALGVLGACAFGVLARRRGIRLWSPVLLSAPILTRNLAETLGTASFVSALALIPLGTAAAMIQATPLMMTLAAALLLREQVGWRRWTAIAVGFAGVLMILRPGMAGFEIGTLLALLGVVCLAARDLAARFVPREVSTLQLSFYGFAAVIPAGLILLPITGGPTLPAPVDAALLVLCAAIGVTGYYMVTAAVRLGDVSVVTPFRYTRLIFAGIVGAIAFAERPDGWTLTGAALIMAAGLYTLLREARLRRRAR